MKIEITVEGQEPIYHKLTKDKTILGSGQDCDVTIEADGISRKHLQIIAENDQYFVVDQGSTNGSFINEERMVPGQRASFTSFFPVKMGFYVTLALLSDDEASDGFDFAKSLPKQAESSAPKAKPAQASAPKPMSSSGTQTSTKISAPRNIAEKPGKKASKEDEKGSQSLKTLAIVIAVGGTLGLWFLTKSDDAPQVSQDVVTAVVEKPKIDLSQLSFEIPEVTGVSTAANSFSDQKCNSDVERAFCQDLGLPYGGYPLSGAVVSPSSIILVLPQLSKTQVLTEFGQSLKWNDSITQQIPEVLDPRDIIALFLSRSKQGVWAGITPERVWFYVIFIDQTGRRTGEIWVASLAGLKAIVMDNSFVTNLKYLSTEGPKGADFLSGLFRVVVD
ncbi:MAG: FHA domain-containing protein [Bacteriovoracaceae bacterium]|nr:FHA domain-containing protein [Bacteriovoracaceae bacterium]